MATYKGIQGYSVQKLSSDPTASEAEGQLWYNSTAGKFKISTAGAGAWASGGNVNQGRSGPGATLNATVPTALIFSGEVISLSFEFLWDSIKNSTYLLDIA